jgi:hypothetical protein
MPFWTSRSDAGSPWLAVTLIVGSILAMTAGGGTASAASGTESWWTAAGGYEDDVTANLDLGLEPVAGGSFLQFSGGLAHRTPGWRPLELNLQGSWQRFLESGRRSLGAAAMNADARLDLHGRWELRPALSGFFLEDTARPDARLLGAGTDLALVRRGPRLDLEVHGGWEIRHYPRLNILDADSVLHTHQESRLLVGPGFSWRPSTVLATSGSITGAWADARDDWYDAGEVTILAAVRWQLESRLRLLSHGFRRQRHFRDRPSDRDDDLTLQIGLAAEWDLSRSSTATVGWVATRYRDPLAERQNLDRVSLALTYRFGGRRTLTTSAVPPQPLRAGHPVTLRLQAPGARAVSVVGDFNGWDPLVHRLSARQDGWWAIEVDLPAGVYQYAFWVDGALVAPSQDEPTVPDGFGGRNGLLVIQP